PGPPAPGARDLRAGGRRRRSAAGAAPAPARRRRTAGRLTARTRARAAREWGGCVALAAASLALPSAPTYDPWAWIVFGRELVLPGPGFSTIASTGWKPLAVLFTAPLSLAGSAAP